MDTEVVRDICEAFYYVVEENPLVPSRHLFIICYLGNQSDCLNLHIYVSPMCMHMVSCCIPIQCGANTFKFVHVLKPGYCSSIIFVV